MGKNGVKDLGSDYFCIRTNHLRAADRRSSPPLIHRDCAAKALRPAVGDLATESSGSVLRWTSGSREAPFGEPPIPVSRWFAAGCFAAFPRKPLKLLAWKSEPRSLTPVPTVWNRMVETMNILPGYQLCCIIGLLLQSPASPSRSIAVTVRAFDYHGGVATPTIVKVRRWADVAPEHMIPDAQGVIRLDAGNYSISVAGRFRREGRTYGFNTKEKFVTLVEDLTIYFTLRASGDEDTAPPSASVTGSLTGGLEKEHSVVRLVSAFSDAESWAEVHANGRFAVAEVPGGLYVLLLLGREPRLCTLALASGRSVLEVVPGLGQTINCKVTAQTPKSR